MTGKCSINARKAHNKEYYVKMLMKLCKIYKQVQEQRRALVDMCAGSQEKLTSEKPKEELSLEEKYRRIGKYASSKR